MGNHFSKNETEKSKPGIEKHLESTDDRKDTIFQTRDKLLHVGLHSEAYRYAKKQLSENPEDTELMALLGQTACEYERVMSPHMRVHWIDRLDVLHNALEVTHRCLQKDPLAWQCARYFTLCAVKAADQQFYFPELKEISLIHNWRRIHDVGDRVLAQHPTSDVAMALGAMDSRTARPWYTPYGLLQRVVYRLPPQNEMLKNAVRYHTLAKELDPENMENVTRLAIAHLLLGDHPAARKWFSYVRDEMTHGCEEDVLWSSLAHTNLSTHLQPVKNRAKTWIPFA